MKRLIGRILIVPSVLVLLIAGTPYSWAQEGEPAPESGSAPTPKAVVCTRTVDEGGTNRDFIAGSCIDFAKGTDDPGYEKQTERCECASEDSCISASTCNKEKTDDLGKAYTENCGWMEASSCTNLEGASGGTGGTIRTGPRIRPATPPTPVRPVNLGQLITQIYNWSLSILGVAVFAMITYGGALWLTAAGNPGKITAAKSKISNALLGAILLLSSYVILNLINPDLLTQGIFLEPLGGRDGGAAAPGTAP